MNIPLLSSVRKRQPYTLLPDGSDSEQPLHTAGQQERPVIHGDRVSPPTSQSPQRAQYPSSYEPFERKILATLVLKIMKSPSNVSLLRGIAGGGGDLGAVRPLSECRDGSEPFASMILDNRRLNVAVKEDATNGMIMFHFYEQENGKSTYTSIHSFMMNACMEDLTTFLYFSQRSALKDKGYTKESMVILKHMHPALEAAHSPNLV